tara:strand:+ start:1822 stop:2559 length:738 start_codon:yes stop_codon:yes gene_type:complete
MIPRRIFVFWTGDNVMGAKRTQHLESLREKSGCEVILITPENLSEWIVEDFDHEIYNNLSLYHKADYLKAYFAYFHASGYSDIKNCNYEWEPYFEQLESAEGIEVIGYAESRGGISQPKDAIALKYKDADTISGEMQKNQAKVCGVCHYIFREPKSKIATLWRERQFEILDFHRDTILTNPAQHYAHVAGKRIHGRHRGRNPVKITNKYPLGWADLGGNSIHKIFYENNDITLRAMPGPVGGARD